MTDMEFMAWLKGYCAATQGCDFGPIVPFFRNADGTINRQRTLDGTPFGNLEPSCVEKLLTTK